jgi:ABC-type transport system involved in cytochrome c biogenesis permease component
MQHTLLMKRTILVASLLLVPLILPGLALAAEQVKGTMSSAEAQEQGLTQIAVGSVKDTLKACLGRIPQDASTGQLMLAEQNCQ